MDINSLLAAFVGAFMGVATGFLGAFFLDWRRLQRERRMHILALVREILSNNVRVQLLLKEARREGTLDDQAWRAVRVPLAGELSLELYNRVASRYDEFSEARRLYNELASGDTPVQAGEHSERLSRWADAMMEENDRLRAEIGDRKDGLLRALRRRERRHQTDVEAGVVKPTT